MKKVAPGVYRTTKPIPVNGSWKSLIRLHTGNSLTALPLYLPADSAIPVAGVPALPRTTRAFVSDHKLLQREQKTAAGYLWGIAYGVILALAFGFLCLLAWGVHRVAIAKTADEDLPQPEREARRRAPARRSPPARVAPGGVR
jgi:hypothetical protein